MQKKLFNIIVNIFLIPLMFLSLLGASTTLGNNLISASRSGILLVDVIIVVSILTFLLRRSRIKLSLVNKRMFAYSGGILLLAWQIYLVFTVSGMSLWDPGSIILKATGKISWAGETYFSAYPNTFLMVMVEHGIWKLFGQPSLQALTLIIGFLNYILLDLGLINLFYLGKKYLHYQSATMLGLGVVLLGVTPWAVIPYSDIPAFSLTSFTITALLAFYNANSLKKRYCYAGVSGLFIGLDYLVKPSLIITIIAFVIVALVNIKRFKLNWNVLGAIGVMVVIPFVMFIGISVYQQHNSYLRIDSSKAVPMMHFAAMGATGNGAFNEEDVRRDTSIKDPVKKRRVDTQIWKRRVKKMGWTGYQAFLLKKQIANTADGTFAWGVEGHFLKLFKNRPSSLGQRLFYTQNGPNYNSAVKILLQLLWMGTLFAALFAVGDDSFIGLLAKYATVGFFLFLLLFEGGRSRYVIQFLPFILLLAGIGVQKLKILLHS